MVNIVITFNVILGWFNNFNIITMRKSRKTPWWLPADFFRAHKDDHCLGVKADHIRYKFNGFVCPDCNMVYQYMLNETYEPLPDFPTIGKDRKVCSNCA